LFTTSGTYPWSFVTQIFHSSQPNHGGDRKAFEVMTSTDIIDKKFVDRCSSCFFFVLLFVKFEGNKGNKLGLIDFPSDFYRLFSG
jgi:hypothetical protein